MKRYLPGLGWALGMLVLILDGQTALRGAAAGLQLCIQTLIPSLFPFFLMSAMLTSSFPGGLLLSGILGGYPVGAGNVAMACRRGQVSRNDARRLVVLCNCAGPSFLFGVLGPVLGGPGKAAALWGVYLWSVFALWTIFPKSRPSPSIHNPMTVQQALFSSLRAMAGVCGWVVFFRVWLAILDRWVLWLLPEGGRILVYGLLELSNGCLALEAAEPELRFVLAAGMVGFGGLCVFLQTAGVAGDLPLSLYFPGKVFQSAAAMLVASFLTPGAISPLLQAGLALIALSLVPVLRKNEKRCGNPCPAGV